MTETEVIIIGLGANLPSAHGGPAATLRAALARLAAQGVTPLACSRFWRTRPVPFDDPGQPWFVNAVAQVATALEPPALLALLHDIEAAFGRVRGRPNAPRPLDLDLLAYGARRWRGDEPGGNGLVLPHPRLRERAFVLLPLREILPAWRHPGRGDDVAAMIARLPADQQAEPL